MATKCGTSTITDIPAGKVAQVIADFQLDDPKPTVTKKRQTNGSYSVTADYGPCADGSVPKAKKKHT